MKSKKNPKIKYGKVDLPEDAFESKNVKARITMWIGMDLLEEVKKRAATKDLPYQTYLNQVLRDSILGSDEDERIRKLIREELSKRTG
jgi:predicted DNA binding CopG/RHH family protein